MAPIGSRKEFFFWTVAALAATTILVIVLTRNRAGVSARTSIHVTGNADRGAELFFGAKRCSICHAVNGVGGRLAPDLRGMQPGKPAMGWLTSVLWNHAPGMWRRIRGSGETYPKLDQQEMANMLAFLYQSGNTDPPGNVDAGRRVFEENSCSRCHAMNGKGGTGGPDLAKIGPGRDANAWIRTMWNHAHQMIEPVTHAVGKWPQLDGAAMNNLLAYLSSGSAKGKPVLPPMRGNAERGWKVFQAKCIRCHSLREGEITLGPALGAGKDLPLTTARFAALLWNHAPAMVEKTKSMPGQLPKIEGEEIADVSAFLASLRFVETSGSALVGEKVFSERGCAVCHGAGGEGGPLAPPLRKPSEAYTSVSFATALWRHGPRMLDRSLEKGMTWPVMQASDVGDIVAFLNAR